MAVALESFSIREYAGKMRDVDFGKCWPFDGSGKDGGEMGRSLPPISLRKFRWWTDELEAARSHHAVGGEPGGAGGGVEIELEKAGSLDESMAEPIMDGEEVKHTRAPSKGKQRAPKKRSIVELFAVAPQIEAVEEESDGEERQDPNDGGQEQERQVEEDGLGAGDGGCGDSAAPEAPRKRKEDIQSDKQKEMLRRKIRMKYKNINNKMKKNKLKFEICAAKKEKILKPKLSCVVDISLLLQGSVCKKRFGKTIMDPVDARKKKPPKGKGLSKKHSFNFVQTSRLITKSRKEAAKVFPVHSILKNRTRAISTKKTSLKGDAQGDYTLKPCYESEKHVTFSGKDEILGHNKSYSPMELPQLQSLCKIFSDVLAASSVMKELNNGDKLPPASEGAQLVKENAEDAATCFVQSTVRSSSTNEQSHCHATFPINLSHMNCPDTEETSLGGTIDLNCAIQSYSNLNCLDPGDSALSPRHSNSGNSQILISTYKDGLCSENGYQAEESLVRASNPRSLPVPIGNCVTSSDATSTLTITRSLVSHPSASCSVTSTQASKSRPNLSIEPQMDSFGCSPEFQPVSNISPRESMSSMFSSVEPNKHGESGPVSDPLSIRRDKRINDGFIGLPLNSQGELIKSNSSGKFSFSTLFKKQNMALGSDHTFPLPNFAEPKNRMDHVNMKEMCPGAWNDLTDPASHLIAFGTSTMELQDFGRIETEKDGSGRDTGRFLHQAQNPVGASCFGCRENFQEDGNLDGIQPATQTTMRLMGKNVTVGKSSNECQGFDDEKIWTDKKIITEQCPSIGISDEPVRWLQQERIAHRASGASREDHLQLLEAPSSLYHMHFDCQPQWISSNGLSSTIGNHRSEVNRSSQQLPSKALVSKTSKSVVNYNSLTESVKMGHQMPVVVSHPQSVCQQMLLSSTHCKHIQNLAYSATSTSHPSFQNHVNGNLMERSSAHSSSHLPHWLLNAKQQKKNQRTPFPYSTDPAAMHHSCTMSGTNLPSLPPRYPASANYHPLYNTSASRTCGSSTPASSVRPSFIPSYQARKPTPAFNANYRDIKSRDRTKSKFAYFKLLDRANITKKRPADRDVEYMRQVKKPNLTLHKQSNVPSGPRRREQLLGCVPYGTGKSETFGYGNKVMDIGLTIMENEKDGLRTAPGSNSLKFDGGSRSGPVKLSAGAKHILKPSQTLDQDNSRPIHSIVPFTTGSSSGKIPVSQMKAAKVYRF